MIIDVHAHVSAPPELYAYQANMMASRAPAKRILKLEDEKVEKGLKSHLKVSGRGRHRHAAAVAAPLYPDASRAALGNRECLYPGLQQSYCPAGRDVSEQKFKGVAGIPQSPGAPIKNCLPELERCVKELGFVGLLINPDPGARGDDSTPGMGDEYWYPLYEKMCELDVPGMIHSSTCLSSRLNYTLHFINEESIAVVSLVNSKVFEHFPKLKIVCAHGGGAIPYHMGRFMAGRYQSRRDMARKAVSPDQYFENVAKKIYYDTCLYTRGGAGTVVQGDRSGQLLLWNRGARAPDRRSTRIPARPWTTFGQSSRGSTG